MCEIFHIYVEERRQYFFYSISKMKNCGKNDDFNWILHTLNCLEALS